MSGDGRINKETSRAPYEAPRVIRVRIDPVKELLQGTPCIDAPNSTCGPGF